jgi:hypothetical protein
MFKGVKLKFYIIQWIRYMFLWQEATVGKTW